MPNVLLTDAELAALREDTIQLRPDIGTFERITVPAQYDRTTKLVVPETRIHIWTGPVAMYPNRSRRDRFDELGEGLVFTRQYRVGIPYTVTTIQIRDRFTLVVSADPQAVGREMEVRDVEVETNMGYRRISVHDFRE